MAEQRVIGQSGETIPLDYLVKCHEYHEEWMANMVNNNNIVIDGNNDKESTEYMNNIIKTILTHINVKSTEEDYILMFDGGSRGNPGPAGCGFVIYNHKYRLVCEGSKSLGIQTNNYAEYMGLLLGLKKARHQLKNLIIKGDYCLLLIS